MSTEKEKEVEVTAAAPAEDKPEIQKQVQTATTDAALEKKDESTKEVEAPQAAAPPAKEDESGKQPETTDAAAPPAKEDEAATQEAEVQLIAEPPSPVETPPEDGAGPAEDAGLLSPASIMDSTCIQEIHLFVAEDDGKLLGNPELHQEMLIFNSGGSSEYIKKSETEKLEYGKDLCVRYYWQMNKATLRTGAAMVEYAIEVGTGFRILKDLAKDNHQSWEEWYLDNMHMPDKTLRTVQKYMLLSRREDAHPYKHLGLEKLLHLISATKTYEVEDKIGAFLTKFNIVFDEESQETVRDFECKVEAGIMVTRLSKVGVTVPFDLMLRFASSRLNLNTRMIDELKLLKDNRERVYGYIDSVIANQGKLPDPMETTEINYFNSMVQRMIKRIGEMVDKAALARQLSLATITELEQKIAALKTLIAAN